LPSAIPKGEARSVNEVATLRALFFAPAHFGEQVRYVSRIKMALAKPEARCSFVGGERGIRT